MFFSFAILSVSVLFHALSVCCFRADILQQHSVIHICSRTTAPSCHTLDSYSETANSNTDFIFLDDYYELNKNITFSNLSNIVLRRACENCNKSVINCKWGVGFKFEYIENLTIDGLTLHNCSRMHTEILNFYHDSFLHTALYLSYISNLFMFEVTVQYTFGYGVFFLMLSGRSSISHCCFQYSFSSVKEIASGNAMLTLTECTDLKRRYTHIEITHSTFLNGSSEHYYTATGLAIMLTCSGINVTLENVTFEANEAKKNSANGTEVYHFSGGNLAIGLHNISTNNLICISNCTFSHGKAFHGAGMYLSFYATKSLENCGTTVVLKNSKFLNNTAYKVGGGIHVRFFHQLSHGNFSCVEKVKKVKTKLELNNCTFEYNIVQTEKDAGIGVAIVNAYADSSQTSSFKFIPYSILLEHCNFMYNNNTPIANGKKSSGSAVLYASRQNGDLLIKDCLFSSNGVTALAAFQSKLYFSGNVTIYNNSGYEGGGIILCEASYMIMNPNTNITIKENNALFTGGGIFAESRCVQIQPLCFYQINSTNRNLTKLVKNKEVSIISINLVHNSAGYAGSQLFGGSVGNCHLPGVHKNIHFHDLFNIQHNDSDFSIVSSDPLNACICTPEEIMCNTSYYTVSKQLYANQKFNISIVTVGQQYETAPGKVNYGTVPGEVDYTSDRVVVTPSSQHLSKSCTNVSLSVHPFGKNYSGSGETNITVKVKNQHANYQLNTKSLQIIVSLKETPLGFSFSPGNFSYICVDKPNLAEENFQCLLMNNSQAVIKRPFPKWLGYYNESNHKPGFIVYKRCPINYCREDAVDIPTSNSKFSGDLQCASHRSGVLCGQCKAGFSLTLGSQNCYNCSNHAILKTIFWSALFLLAGIVIVVLILFTNFTVTQGTVSELLFYANTIFIYKATLGSKVSVMETTAFRKALTVMVNVINLNYGHENCYYNGMDLIGRTWLQLSLVLYIWILTSIIVFTCRKSQWLSDRIGYNAVPGLATILLLSCSPLNLSILYALTFASLDLPHQQTLKFVLLFDGNVPYFSAKHIPLFIVGCVFAVLSFGFTMMLLLVQPLKKYSHFKLLRWVNHLKPLLDAYTCPHIIKPHCRFWNGLLLFLRTFLYVCYIIEYDYVLFSINVICLFIQAVGWAMGGVYTKKHLNIISSSYIINIGVLSVISTYLQHSPTIIATANSVSITIAAVTMLCTLAYHVMTQLKHRDCFKRICNCISHAASLAGRNDRAMRSYLIVSDSDDLGN